MENKTRKLLIVISIVSLICSLVFGMGTTAYAETPNKVTATTSTSLTQGNSGQCYVYIDSLENVSTLNLSIYYDSSKVTIISTYNSVSCSLYDSAINTDSLNYSYIFDGNGAASKTRLFYFNFTVNSTAEAGDTYFDIVVSDAYDSALNEIEIDGSRTAFTIKEKVVSKTATITGTNYVYTSIEQEFELSYKFSITEIASGSATITYDSELFEIVSVEQGEFLSDKFVDVNTELNGSIYISFVSTEYSSSKNFVTVKFKTLQNVATSSSIKMNVADLYDLDLNYISCSTKTTTINVSYDESYVEDAPKMSLSNSYDAQNGKLTVQIDLEANSHLGAGDFVVSFDAGCLSYVSNTKGFSPSFFNINDKDVENGVIKFSIISLEDIVESQKVMTIEFDVLPVCVDSQLTITIAGNNLYDSSTEHIIKLNFIDTSLGMQGVGHTPGEVVVENNVDPTCIDPGSYDNVVYCSVCHMELSRETVTVPATGHNFDEGTPRTYPTCTSWGITDYKCLACGYSKASFVEPLPHNYVAEEVTPPTCTSQGSTTLVCDGCGHLTYGDYIDALGHDYESVVTPPTCYNQGWTTHTCKKCGLVRNDQWVNATGHSYGDWVITTKPTCVSYGYQRQYCTSCGVGSDIQRIPPTGVHDYGEWVITVHPTCLNGGQKCQYCTTCGESNSQSIPATGHSYESVVVPPDCYYNGYTKHTCTTCGYWYHDSQIPSTGHNYEEKVIPPTCTEMGQTIYTCTGCGQWYNSYVSNLGHDYISHEAKEPTCTEVGWSAYKTCSRCDYTTYKERPARHGPMSTTTFNPTCTEKGYTRNTCLTCGYVYATNEVDPLGHRYTTVVTAPTCTAQGYTTYTCSTCKHAYTDDYIDALGHTEGSIVVENNSAPDCVNEGSYDNVVYCTVCGEELSRDTITVDALGHDEVHHEAKAPTCTEIGWNTYETCTRCDYTTYTEKAALGHWLTYYSAKSPTCLEVGCNAYESCNRCDYTTYQEIPATGHSHNAVVTAPTCTAQGYTTHTCHCGDSYIDNYVDVLGHTEVVDSAVAATCTTTGLTEGKHCSVCNTILVAQQVVNALGHTEGEIIVENNIAPNCTENGSYDNVVYCTVCDAELSRNTVVVDALGHTYDNGVVTTKPTCTTDGIKTFTCHCGHSYTEVVNQLGHDEIKHNAQKETCTAIGWNAYVTCSRCDYTTYVEISATGHSYRAVVTPPTCTTQGYTTHTCNCGDSYVDTYVNATGHVNGSWITDSNPTCTTAGSKHQVCATCGATINTESIPATGHNPENDDGDCTTAIKCSVCQTVVVEGNENHIFTDDKDTACNSVGCNHTRVVVDENAEQFKQDVAAIANATTKQQKMTAINTALASYVLVEDKASVASEYNTLKAAIDEYNAQVEDVNQEYSNATDVATRVIASAVGIASALAGVWILLKKRILGGAA